MDALSLAEFLATFGVLCEAPVLALDEVQQAAARPLASGALQQMYMALLRCVLLEKVRFVRLILARLPSRALLPVLWFF
jgi:hypothetical protein